MNLALEDNFMQIRSNKVGSAHHSKVQSCYEWADALFIAVVILVLAFSFCLRIVSVSGPSMQPNLFSSDKVLLTYFGTSLQCGDVIVIEHTNSREPIIKRVVATGGQTVDIHAGIVSVNGQALDESAYLVKGIKTEQEGTNVHYPLTVPEGKIFVLGDNRSISLDSRSSEIGLIDQKDILGKAQLVLFPFSHFGKIKG
ncbi:signal peptidase I [Caproicibacterium lactatifermentans]|jgi:signal peptidase I|uniref:Signal peptidase I n=2 Tax=Caproicibacterium lactatifermentans TaxID=2666138 RepID=A0A859DQ94_9FIRM|nr:signal peptidase I [Caproicibacterium lactatifermentans]